MRFFFGIMSSSRNMIVAYEERGRESEREKERERQSERERERETE